MNNLRILGPNEIGKGVLIEYDAGYISPKDKFNADILKEQKDFLDTQNHLSSMLYYRNIIPQIETEEYILKEY